MVLQREDSVPIWGWADHGEEITATVAGQSQTTKAGADGKWMVKFSNLAANDATTLTIKGKNTITIQDVLIGEVWLGSGQSNMVMLVKNTLDAEKEQEAADLPMIRLFTETSNASNEAQTIGEGQWVACSPTSVATFSAALYFFGREVHQTLKTPVGLIVSAVGGTPIESWIDAKTQQDSAALKPLMAKAEPPKDAAALKIAAERYQKALAKWKEDAAKARAAKLPLPRQPRDPVATNQKKGNVGGLFNGKIAPLIPYAIRGALWYQGEANSSPDKAPFYRHQLALLINDWRARWGNEFPFAWVQLAGFAGPGRDWPTVREGMRETLSLPKTGMAVAIDIGDEKDIHPKNKKEVGHRLALWALGTVYKREVPATSSPLPLSHEIRGNEISVRFAHANKGLISKDGDLLGFEIAGADGQWKLAKGKIDGDQVILSSAEVTAPTAVRYAWANFPKCNLYSGAGLPASPFQIPSKP